MDTRSVARTPFPAVVAGLCLTVGLGLFGARAAHAQPPQSEPEERGIDDFSAEHLADEAARVHFRLGVALYREGRAHEAAGEFALAHQLSGRPELLYNRYLAHRDAGELEPAADALAAYLASAVVIDDREALERRLASMRERIQAHEAELAERERVRQERDRIEAERSALEAEREAEQRSLADAEARRAPAWSLVTGAGGLAVLGAAGVTSILTVRRQSTLDAVCPDHTCPRDQDVSAERDAVRRTAISTDVLLASGGAALLTGLIGVLVRRRRGARSDRRVEPGIATRCVGGTCSHMATLAGSF
ncbi:MAG: hypothetical protein KC593_05785 [Myxococcales bacterium]|nr:hypothetical protein [Myxococcales bacterium]